MVVSNTNLLSVIVKVATLLAEFVAVTLAPFTKLTVFVLAEMAPTMVIEPDPPIDVLAAIVTPPLAIAAELELTKAPLALIPEPLKLRAFARLNPLRSSVNPDPTVTVPIPNGPLVTEPAEPVEAMPALNVPPETVVPPEYVLAPERVSVPEPALVNDPFPEMTEVEELLALTSIVKLLILETFELRVNVPLPADNLNALLVVFTPFVSVCRTITTPLEPSTVPYKFGVPPRPGLNATSL